MGKIVLVWWLMLPLAAYCGQGRGFVLRGVISGRDTGTVELSYRLASGDDTSITAVIRSGSFALSGMVPEPELVRMTIYAGSSMNHSFYLENADISIRLVGDDDAGTVVTGSASDLLYQRLLPQQRDFFSYARAYDDAHERAVTSRDAVALHRADSIWAGQLRRWTDTIGRAIKAQPRNYASLYFVQWLLFHPPGYDTLISLYQALAPEVRRGLYARDFMTEAARCRRTSAGQPAPEIAGTDTSGGSVLLAPLRGKVVLLDFWASYCARCRQENPEVRTLYDKYHAGGFDIVSVSLDYDRAAWIKAIQKDGMIWHHSCELRGGSAASAALYDVQELPRNWLLDREGKIIAHDLSLPELAERLRVLCGK
ncbi:MAG: AhpC/TSA family protein [Bacteroidetes bacterium]|nr:AhpC/TSA family protein [Bacteroidota bacterium]